MLKERPKSNNQHSNVGGVGPARSDDRHAGAIGLRGDLLCDRGEEIRSRQLAQSLGGTNLAFPLAEHPGASWQKPIIEKLLTQVNAIAGAAVCAVDQRS